MQIVFFLSEKEINVEHNEKIYSKAYRIQKYEMLEYLEFVQIKLNISLYKKQNLTTD